jgi:hypothetical protein
MTAQLEAQLEAQLLQFYPEAQCCVCLGAARRPVRRATVTSVAEANCREKHNFCRECARFDKCPLCRLPLVELEDNGALADKMMLRPSLLPSLPRPCDGAERLMRLREAELEAEALAADAKARVRLARLKQEDAQREAERARLEARHLRETADDLKRRLARVREVVIPELQKRLETSEKENARLRPVIAELRRIQAGPRRGSPY